MIAILNRPARALKAILKDRRAIGYVEFAFTLPPVMMLFMGGGELANLAITHARVSQIAQMTADNAARVRNRMDEVDVNEMFIGTKLAGNSINLLQNGRVIVSSVEDNDATTSNTTDQVIMWQRCKGVKAVSSSYGAQGAVLSQPIGSGTRRIQAKPGEPVVFVEIQYDYKPIIGGNYFGAHTFAYTSAFIVRDRPEGTMQNGANLSDSQKSLCSAYNAT